MAVLIRVPHGHRYATLSLMALASVYSNRWSLSQSTDADEGISESEETVALINVAARWSARSCPEVAEMLAAMGEPRGRVPVLDDTETTGSPGLARFKDSANKISLHNQR